MALLAELVRQRSLLGQEPDADNIHGIDESVGLDAMLDVTRVLALTIAEWCGLERLS